MAMKIIEAKDRKELRTKVNEGDYTVIKKVTGGYACFEYQTDYDTWKKQK